MRSAIQGKRQRRPPNLFGPYRRMDLLIALAVHGTLRRADVTKTTGLQSIDLLHVSDRAGLVARWRLSPPSLGYALALNPAFPRLTPLRQLLRAMSREYPPPYRSSCAPEHRNIPVSAKRRSDIRYLFGSPVRTMTLLTLEFLGGQSEQRTIHRSVPSHHKVSVKNVLKFYVAQGLLVKKGRVVTFSDRRWVQRVRQLLRSVARANPQLTLEIRELAGRNREPRSAAADHRSGLLGYAGFERVITELALHGPTNWATLTGRSRADAELAIRAWRRLGILISKKQGHARFLSLNAAHPVYPQLRALLVAMSDQECDVQNEDWSEPLPAFGIDRLFLSGLRTSVICLLEACPRGLDATTLSRLLPEHDRHKLADALRYFVRQGVVQVHEGRLKVYSLDPLWQYGGELKALLQTINTTWPGWRNAARVEKRLRPKRRPRAAQTKYGTIERLFMRRDPSIQPLGAASEL